MNIRTLFCGLLLLGATARPGSAATPPDDHSPRPPNIVLIISDDHAWTDYGFMGHPHIRTPHLDRLAKESRLFPRGYVPASVCAPSLASIITGRFPHEHGVVCNDPPVPAGLDQREFYRSEAFREGREKLSRLIERTPTLPRLLQEAGYLTLQTGKWWQNHHSRAGFTHGMTHGDEDRGGRHGDEGLAIGRKTMKPIHDFIDEAVAEEKPFFIWYAPFLPHNPHNPPERLLKKYEAVAPSIHIARYWAMVEWFDETCGALREHLQSKGLSESTIIAYVADNGWIQSSDSPKYAPRSKQSPYDGGLRTPILLHWPGHIQPARSETAISSVDLMPTLLRLAGCTPPADLPGRDLLDNAAIQGRKAVFGACFTHDCVDLDNPAKGLRWRWVVAGDWKLILPAPQNETGGAELYRILSDPLEKENVTATHPAEVARLTGLLDDWWEGKP